MSCAEDCFKLPRPGGASDWTLGENRRVFDALSTRHIEEPHLTKTRVPATKIFIRLVPLAIFFSLIATAKAQIRSFDTPLATLRLSESTGDLVGLRWKNPDLELIGDSRLGENFRVLVPDVGYGS